MLYHHECISTVVVAVPWRVMLPVRPLCIMVWKYAGTCIAIVGYRLSVLELRHSSNSGKRVSVRITGPNEYKSWESFCGGITLPSMYDCSDYTYWCKRQRKLSQYIVWVEIYINDVWDSNKIELHVENGNYSFHNFFRRKDCKMAAKTFNQSINIALIVPSKNLSTLSLIFFFWKGVSSGCGL